MNIGSFKSKANKSKSFGFTFFVWKFILITKGDGMARKIVVTSGKGGVGKTTITANLGYALARSGLKVLLFDADLGLNNLDVVMGVENKVVYDLLDILNGKCRPMQAVVQDFFNANLYVLPSNHFYCNLDHNGDVIKEIIAQFDEYFDYIIIDSPAGIEGGFLRAINCADEAIVVTTPHLSAIRDCNKVINVLQGLNVGIVGLIVNRVRGDLILEKECFCVEDIAKYLKLNIVGAIPESDVICQQLSSGGELKRNAEASLAFNCVVSMIHKGSSRVYDCTKKYRGIIGSIKRSIRKWV